MHGNEVLAGQVKDYAPDLPRENPHYTVANIRLALTAIGARGSIPGFGAFDQFALYLVLDALVAGQDRHHENWAVARLSGSAPRLAPSFDHGNGLGFTEGEEQADRRASDPVQLANWVARGTGHNFAGGPKLVDLAAQAVALCDEPIRHEIRNRVDLMQFTGFVQTMRTIPANRMSEAHRKLATCIVEANKRRLLDAIVT